MMYKSSEYAQVQPNFDSAYNISQRTTRIPTMYIPMSSSATFSTLSNRPSSPLFHRSISPPPRPPISTRPGPKFNFDLYKMDDNIDEYDNHTSHSYRPISPPTNRIIHHYPIDSPYSSSRPTSPISQSQPLSKLRQINDELCQALARSELTDQPPHYHIHHYPVSQPSPKKHRPRSTPAEYSPPTKLEVSPKIHKARVTYKIHIPRQRRSEEQHHGKSSRPKSPSDTSSSDSSMTIDLYPTRDQGFVKQRRKKSEYQSPWIVDGRAIRRSSYSDTSSSHTPKGPYYGDKPIRSSSSRARKPEWQHPSKIIPEDPPKYYKPSLRSKYDVPIRKRIIDATESDPISQRRTSSSRVTIRTGDPKLKKRIANVESKVKSTWEPTTTSLTRSMRRESTLPIPPPVKTTTITTPPKSKTKAVSSEPVTPIKKVVPAPPTSTSTGRSLLNDVPRRPMFESTPRNQSFVDEDDDSVADLFGKESTISERKAKKSESPRSPPRIEGAATLPQQPRKPHTELPKTTVPEPDTGTKSTVKDGVLVRGNDTNNIHKPNPVPSTTSDINAIDNGEQSSDAESEPSTPHPPKVTKPERKAPVPLPKTTEKRDESVVHQDNEDDEEVANSFDLNKWLSNAKTSILGPTRNDNAVLPRLLPKSNATSPPRRKVQPLSPTPDSPDHDLYKPPFGPKKDPTPAPPPATTTTTTTAGDHDEVDGFFT